MKIHQHFIAVEKDRKTNRTYGGSNYRLAVYENKGRGSLTYLGDAEACTTSHKGELSEAWTIVVEKGLNRGRKAALKRFAANPENRSSAMDYYANAFENELGIKLQIV